MRQRGDRRHDDLGLCAGHRGDGFSLNYRVVLAEEGCVYRSEASHAVSLCDMHAKYADVMKIADVLAYFATIPEGQFDLPKGSGQSRLPPPAHWPPNDLRSRYRVRLAISGWMRSPNASIPMIKSSKVSMTPARPSIVASWSSMFATVA
jgi:hypothetical protein